MHLVLIPGSGHWGNPRATFEQAQAILKLFGEKKKPKKNANAQSNEVDSEESKHITIVDLPDDILLKIFMYLHKVSIPDPNELRAGMKAYAFDRSKWLAVKSLYGLRIICKRFDNIMCDYHASFPKPPIGLRLQAAVNRGRTYGKTTVAYIYGDCGRRCFEKSVHLRDVPAAIFPGQICTFFVIKGLVLTEDLIDMLLRLDLSKVEELFWYDIRGSQVKNLVEKMQQILRKMTSLVSAEFYATDDYFDPMTMFPDTDRYWTELGLEKTDNTAMKSGEVRIVKWASLRSPRSRRRRAICWSQLLF